MTSLKINIPEGFKIDTFNQQTGEVSFAPVPKEVTERIKSFWDVLADHGITMQAWEKEINGVPADEIAFKQLKLIAKSLNEGWEPDWGNSSEWKYYPWFNMGGSSGSGFSYYDCDGGYSRSFVGSRLCFKSGKLAKYAGEQFTDIYKQFYLNQ